MTPTKSRAPREFMQRAVDIMGESVDEPRHDGKVCPKVGAVLLKPDGSVDAACRGELRYGDHAEFTLLERKNRAARLDGSVLYTTLEPCAPGARRHPKLSCAERIALARIRQVWIGIEDPDPTVARKGIEYLRGKGIDVRMFDADLQQVIRDANKDYLDGAMRRAEQEEQQQQEIALSSLEEQQKDAVLDDLSGDALDRYRRAAGVAEPTDSAAFNRYLARLGLVREKDGQFRPTGAGFLLFGQHPRTAMPQAGLLGTIHFPDGTEEIRNFEGPQVDVPDQVLRWLRDRLPHLIDRTEAYRRDANSTLFELVREGIANALVHRDYDVRGAKCQLVVTPDTIIIKSPGRPLEPITLEQLASFSAPMLSRNPVIHYVFRQMGLAEERGLGLRSLKNRAQEVGLPLPRFTWEDPYLVLTIFRRPESVTKALPISIRDSLSDAEITGWEWLSKTGRAKTADYAAAMGVDIRTARRHLNKFVELGLVMRTGAARSTEYQTV